SDSKNTFDAYLPEARYVKHYLLDFGTTLGSAALGTHDSRIGYEYRVDWAPTLKTAATLGIWDRPWKELSYPDYPAVGKLESKYFQPEHWKPDYPNPAYDRM